MNMSGFEEVIRKIYNERIIPMAIAAIPNIAYDIIFNIQSKYEDCVDAFYEDYTPFVYNRLYNTYRASSASENMASLDLFNYTISNNKKNTRITINAGINVDYSRLGEPYVDDAAYVFTRTWEEGIHGTRNIKVMGTSPKKMMDDWFMEFKRDKLSEVVNTALKNNGFTSR